MAEKVRKSNVASPKSNVQCPKSNVASPKSEVQCPKSKVQSSGVDNNLMNSTCYESIKVSFQIPTFRSV